MSMAADVQWQHLPFDVMRNIIDIASRLPVDPTAAQPLATASASTPPNSAFTAPGHDQPASPSASLNLSPALSPPATPQTPPPFSPLQLPTSAITTSPTTNAATGHAPPAILDAQDTTKPEDSHEELLHNTIRSMRLVCTCWRDAAGSAVTQMQLGCLEQLRPERPLATIFPELASLDLMPYGRLYDEDVALFAGCRSLTSLKIPGQRLTSEGLAALAPLTSLERLDVSSLKVPYALAHLLRALPRLRHVTVRGCALQLLPPAPAPPPPAGPPPPPPPASVPWPHSLSSVLSPTQKRFPSSRWHQPAVTAPPPPPPQPAPPPPPPPQLGPRAARADGSIQLHGALGPGGGAVSLHPYDVDVRGQAPSSRGNSSAAHMEATALLASAARAAELTGGGPPAPPGPPPPPPPFPTVRTDLTAGASTSRAPPPPPLPPPPPPPAATTGQAVSNAPRPTPPPPPPGPPPPPPFLLAPPAQGSKAPRIPPPPQKPSAPAPAPPPPPGPPPPPPILTAAAPRASRTLRNQPGPSGSAPSAAARQPPRPAIHARFEAHAAAEAALAPAEAAARLALAMYGSSDGTQEYDSMGVSSDAAGSPLPYSSSAAAVSAPTLPQQSQAAPTAAFMPPPPAVAAATAAASAAAALPPLVAPPLEWCASVPSLESLHLIDVRGMWQGVSALSRLTELVLRDCSKPEQARPFRALAESLPGLRRLGLYGTSAQLQGTDVAEGVSQLRRLEWFAMESLALVPHQLVLRQDLDQLISSLAPLAPTLRCLELRRPGWTLDRLRALAPLTGLTRLDVGDSGPAGRAGRLGGGGSGGGAAGLASDAGMQLVACQFPRLRCFSLGTPSSDAVTEDGVGALAARLRGLTRLELQGCSRLRNEQLGPQLGLMTALQHLDLTNCLNLLDSALSHLTSLSSLISLKLRGCWKISGDGLGVLRPPLLRLRRLDLSDCRVTDEGLQQVAQLTSLTRLQLARSWYIRAPGLAALSRLTRLAVLDLASTNTDDTGVAQMVAGLGLSLTDLDLSATLVHQPGVKALAEGLPRLRRLRLNKCPELEDSALDELSRLRCLRRLHLRYCRKIGDAAVGRLAARLPSLQHMDLNGCWGVAMSTINNLYGRPNGEWRRAGDVARADAAAAMAGGEVEAEDRGWGGCEW